MTPSCGGRCQCSCCQECRCGCTGEPGKDCSCACCQQRRCSCGEQQPATGGQQQPCKCPCCEKAACTCKQASDCNCASCQKHQEAEKKKKERCGCCCCKSDTPCCSESRHQQKCDCRCCTEKTCVCCKSKRAGTSVGAAQSAAGKIISDAVYDRCTSPDSSNRSHCHAARSCCGRSTQWNSNCCNSRRHCRGNPSNHSHCCRSHIQCCRSNAIERQCSNTDGRPGTEEETVNSSGENCVPSQSVACLSCCFLSDVPCRFTAPRFACCGCSTKLHGSYGQHPMRPCDRVNCCRAYTSSMCWCYNRMKGAMSSTVVRPHGAADVLEASRPAENDDSTASPRGGSGSSHGSATEHDSKAAHSLEYFYAPKTEPSCVRCNCCWQCLSTRDVAAEKHQPQRQQRFRETLYTVEHQHGQGANQEQQQLLQKHDEGKKSNCCILDPQERLLLDCKTEEKVLLRRMQPTDYPAVRALLPRVSLCTSVLSDQEVHDVLSSPVFYAWCCFTVEPKQLPPQQQQRQEGTLPQAEKQEQEVEKDVQQLAKEQQIKEQRQESQERQQQGLQLQEETKETRPEFYREKKLVAYCELVLQPRLGRKTDGRLERVVVDEAFCRRGVASRMCSAVLAAVKERGLCGYVDLTVEREEARHIYEDILGFRKVETTVMRLQL